MLQDLHQHCSQLVEDHKRLHTLDPCPQHPKEESNQRHVQPTGAIVKTSAISILLLGSKCFWDLSVVFLKTSVGSLSCCPSLLLVSATACHWWLWILSCVSLKPQQHQYNHTGLAAVSAVWRQRQNPLPTDIFIFLVEAPKESYVPPVSQYSQRQVPFIISTFQLFVDLGQNSSAKAQAAVANIAMVNNSPLSLTAFTFLIIGCPRSYCMVFWDLLWG